MKYQFEWIEIEDCAMCPFLNPNGITGECMLTIDARDIGDTLKPDWCPLVEVQDE